MRTTNLLLQVQKKTNTTPSCSSSDPASEQVSQPELSLASHNSKEEKQGGSRNVTRMWSESFKDLISAKGILDDKKSKDEDNGKNSKSDWHGYCP